LYSVSLVGPFLISIEFTSELKGGVGALGVAVATEALVEGLVAATEALVDGVAVATEALVEGLVAAATEALVDGVAVATEALVEGLLPVVAATETLVKRGLTEVEGRELIGVGPAVVNWVSSKREVW